MKLIYARKSRAEDLVTIQVDGEAYREILAALNLYAGGYGSSTLKLLSDILEDVKKHAAKS